jgi:hypothetical protein
MNRMPSRRRPMPIRPGKTTMDTITPDRSEEGWDAYQAEPGPETETTVPRRARRQFFNRRTAALGALITCAIGFYAGIRLEKGQLSNSSSALGTGGGGRAAQAARFGRGGTTGAAGAAGAGGAAAVGFAGRFGGGAAGGAGASVGTVSSVKGKTIYVTDTSGNTVKVNVAPSTKITKNQSVSRHAIRPGDTIIVTGGSGSGGSTTAATITDSGNRAGATGSGSGGGSGSGSASGSGTGSGGGNSAVGSLFSSGG